MKARHPAISCNDSFQCAIGHMVSFHFFETAVRTHHRYTTSGFFFFQILFLYVQYEQSIVVFHRLENRNDNIPLLIRSNKPSHLSVSSTIRYSRRTFKSVTPSLTCHHFTSHNLRYKLCTHYVYIRTSSNIAMYTLLNQ